MEIITCPLCGVLQQSEWKKVQDRLNPSPGKHYTLVRCTCGFVYLNPRYTENDIAEFYLSDQYDPHVSHPHNLYTGMYNLVRRFALYLKMRTIERHVRKGSLLDIGGGTGEFCRYMQSRHWEVTMFDSSEKARSIAEKRGINCIHKFSELGDARQFDVITLWHSLEHIHDLKMLFDMVKTHLKPDGFLVIAVPSMMANERRFYPDTWAPYDAPRHLYHFSPDNLKRFLDSRGFEICYSLPIYQDTPYNILLSIKNRSFPQLIKAAYVWMSSWSQIFFKGNYFTSSTEVVCRLK